MKPLVDEKFMPAGKLSALQDEAGQLTAIFVAVLKNYKHKPDD